MKKHNEKALERSKALREKSMAHHKDMVSKATNPEEAVAKAGAKASSIIGIVLIIGGLVSLILKNVYIALGLIAVGALTLLINTLRLKKMK